VITVGRANEQAWLGAALVTLLGLLLAAAFLPGPVGAQAEAAFALGDPVVRIKELVEVEGVRPNQLVGLGLVVGLNGTGDSQRNEANVRMVANMLERFGLRVEPRDLILRNVAAVTVTAELPPFARPGSTIDVTVASFGDARSLAGGLLLQTPLLGADGQVYAVAQGSLTLGGGTSSRYARTSSVHPLVAVLPGGAYVERAVPGAVLPSELRLRPPAARLHHRQSVSWPPSRRRTAQGRRWPRTAGASGSSRLTRWPSGPSTSWPTCWS